MNLEKKREMQRIYTKRWRARRPESKRQYDREYRRTYRASHPEEDKRRQQQWRANNNEHLKQYGKRQRRRIKQEMINAYGGKCVCCGEATFEFLTIDHINGDARQDKEQRGLSPARAGASLYFQLRSEGWPRDRYRLLCLNCNFAIGHYGRCPHGFLKQTDSQPLVAVLSEVNDG